MRSLFARALVGSLALVATASMGTGVAGAAPTNAKNAFQFSATCNGQEVPIVVNNANGQGQGTQNPDHNQATFAPAHIVGTNEVFHPTQFDLTFSFRFNGETHSFTNTAVRPNQPAPLTCSIDTTQTAPDGSSFSLVGTVGGWIS